MKDKTILEKIGITQKLVKNWRKRNLKITYPMKARAKFFDSHEGKDFLEGADKFLTPFSKKKQKFYTLNPKKFRADFLRNAKLCFQFCRLIFKSKDFIKNLKEKEKSAAVFFFVLFIFLGIRPPLVSLSTTFILYRLSAINNRVLVENFKRFI